MKKTLFFATVCTLINTSAFAQVYECTDNRGNSSYSESPKGKNCHIINNLGGNFSTVPAYSSPSNTQQLVFDNPNDKIATNQPNSAAVKTARTNLENAQKALEEGKKIRMGNERNYVRYQERIKGLEDNVKARQKELDDALGNKN